MFVAGGIWCLADVSSVSPSLEQVTNLLLVVSHWVNVLLLYPSLILQRYFVCSDWSLSGLDFIFFE